MFKRIESRTIAAAVCMFVFVSIAAAHEVRISDPAKVGPSSELQPGTYRVEVVKNQDSSEVHFYKGSVVAHPRDPGKPKKQKLRTLKSITHNWMAER
jgi:hypothetical protein